MDNRAQVSTEYLVIIAVLTVITVIVAAFVLNFAKMSISNKLKNEVYKDALLKMIEWGVYEWRKDR